MAMNPEQYARRLAQVQVSLYGLMLMTWSSIELALEMVAKREIGLTLKQACIIFGPLGGGAKVALTFSILEGNVAMQPFCEAVRAYQNFLGRNALVHGFPTFKEESDPWVIVSREVKNGLVVRTRQIDRYVETEEFNVLFTRVMETSGFTDQDLHDYGQEIAALARAP